MTPINLVTSLHRIAKHTNDFVSRRAVRRDVRFRALWEQLASKIPNLQPQVESPPLPPPPTPPPESFWHPWGTPPLLGPRPCSLSLEVGSREVCTYPWQ